MPSDWLDYDVAAAIDGLSDPSVQARIDALMRLGAIDPEAAPRLVPVLIERIDDEDDTVRYLSMWKLSELGAAAASAGCYWRLVRQCDERCGLLAVRRRGIGISPRRPSPHAVADGPARTARRSARRSQ